MITDAEIHQMPEDSHRAWINSLSEDERHILHAPIAWRYTLVMISVVKRYLAEDIPADFQLRFLSWLEKDSGEWGADTIAAIQPVCDDAYEMVTEARKLGSKEQFDTFAQWEIFNAFVALNPSLLAAIKSRSSYRRSH